MTLTDLLTALADAPQEAALVFVTSKGEIGTGYHVTELRHAEITGIDCGGVVSRWGEAILQLLDGGGRDHMAVGKFLAIAAKSITQVPELSAAPLRVEFAHGNAGMSIYALGEVAVVRGRAMVTLTPERALCKPAVRAFGPEAAHCCGAGAVETACCG